MLLDRYLFVLWIQYLIIWFRLFYFHLVYLLRLVRKKLVKNIIFSFNVFRRDEILRFNKVVAASLLHQFQCLLLLGFLLDQGSFDRYSLQNCIVNNIDSIQRVRVPSIIIKVFEKILVNLVLTTLLGSIHFLHWLYNWQIILCFGQVYTHLRADFIDHLIRIHRTTRILFWLLSISTIHWGQIS